jgi:hypothetical protein
MSDNEDQEVEVAVVEEEEETDFGLPRIYITPEIVAKGLSEIKRTAGKWSYQLINRT